MNESRESCVAHPPQNGKRNPRQTYPHQHLMKKAAQQNALTVNRTRDLQIFSLTLSQLSYQSCVALYCRKDRDQTLSTSCIICNTWSLHFILHTNDKRKHFFLSRFLRRGHLLTFKVIISQRPSQNCFRVDGSTVFIAVWLLSKNCVRLYCTRAKAKSS